MDTLYKPQNLERWTLPDSYMGEHWGGYYVFLGRNSGSNLLTESNFECGLEAIGGESETVCIVSEGHWACGWIEWIAIHKSDSKALEAADEIVSALADYPVVDESHFSEKEYNAIQDMWESWPVRERAEFIRDNGHNTSIFAARHDYAPYDDSSLWDSLTQYVNS